MFLAELLLAQKVAFFFFFCKVLAAVKDRMTTTCSVPVLAYKLGMRILHSGEDLEKMIRI